jgi:hypothetical protein
MNKVKLRKFPYPYRAALTICSDIDGTRFTDFIEIHRFLNTTQQTSMGPGLRLPISDSFWMYDQPGSQNAAFSYYSDLKGTTSPESSIIRDFIRAGILDVMHTYGNFAKKEDFTRKLAQRALDELDRHQLKVKVWTNHGGPENTQKIGLRSGGLGDIRQSDLNQTKLDASPYHTDLLSDYGIQFYWSDESSLTQVVGQNRPFCFSEAYWKSPLYQGIKLRLKNLAKGMFAMTDQGCYNLFKKHTMPRFSFDPNNNLICFDVLRDEREVFQFYRYGHGRFDWSEDLDLVLNDNVLKKLIEKQGYMMIYIHLGDRRERTETKPLSKSTIQRLKRIAEFYQNGQIWVATTTRLLQYHHAQKYLDWSVKETDTKYTIHIHAKHH